MLTPDYLETCTDDILSLYDDLQSAILLDMVRRIMKMGKITESSAYQMDIYQEAGGVFRDALLEIGKASGKTEQELQKLFEDAGAHTLLYDDKIYQNAGLTPLPLHQSPELLQILLAGLRKTKGNLSNLTLTTILAANSAYMNTISGGMSYSEAIKKSIQSMSDTSGFVSYPLGTETEWM